MTPTSTVPPFRVRDDDLHPHLVARMAQRGVTREEIERTVNEGWGAGDAKAGTSGSAMVFSFGAVWEGHYYDEKEVTVYYRHVSDRIVLLTVKARYGAGFSRKETS